MYDLYIMRRTQIYLDEGQAERLASRAAAEGGTLSALIRRAIDEMLDRERDGSARLAAFRDAVADTAGAVPELPSGESYVEVLRSRDAALERELWGGR